ncbi:MAG: transcription antitermination factor NusB [Tissierellales bacterium]|jgi:N utilization substance protein B|nr:transcription antitermination factor NusB [Tissierellales bacterium]
MSRKLARESAMKLVYQMELMEDFSQEALSKYIDDAELKKTEIEYVESIYDTMVEHREDIDKLISEYAKGWKLERLPKIDLSILRVAILEILYREDIPIEVSINEALEVSKKFSADDSSKFINGVLGSVVREKQ